MANQSNQQNQPNPGSNARRVPAWNDRGGGIPWSLRLWSIPVTWRVRIMGSVERCDHSAAHSADDSAYGSAYGTAYDSADSSGNGCWLCLLRHCAPF